ncbi:MAG TPA: metallophosphoesterase family protein [Candidatus Saccharimonadales bacterium]|nr:metallophosphoesterase family protein [Candidatus Saccharimonadales bacterium]
MQFLKRLCMKQCWAILLLVPTNMFSESSVFPTLTSLIESFEKLPKNREGATYASCGFALKLPDKKDQIKEFKSQIEQWMRMRSILMNDDDLWAPANNNVTKPGPDFFNTTQPLKKFMPYVQRSDGLGYQIIMRGDLHGDISSLIAQLKEMKAQKLIGDDFVLKKNVIMAFLGDYVDRGNYGLEVLYTLALLGNANPDNVWYVRGNHEDIVISSNYGFADEVRQKFNDTDGSLHAWIARMYDFMPVVIYVGDTTGRYAQLCHGGIEQGYHPQDLFESGKTYQLIGTLHRKKALDVIAQDATVLKSVKKDMNAISRTMQDNLVLSSPFPMNNQLPLGFMWNDFDPTGNGPAVKIVYGRGLEYSQAGVNVVLRHQEGSYKIIAIFRAHQHSSDPNDLMMKNILKGQGISNIRQSACDGSIGDGKDKDVYTLNVAPDSVYGKEVGFDYDTSITLTLSKSGSWKYSKQHYFPLEGIKKSLIGIKKKKTASKLHCKQLKRRF